MAKLFRAAIMGPPGSGKGTICKRIAQSFDLQYLSSGHYLRESIAANTGMMLVNCCPHTGVLTGTREVCVFMLHVNLYPNVRSFHSCFLEAHLTNYLYNPS